MQTACVWVKLHTYKSKWSIWHERVHIVTQCHLVGIISRWSYHAMSSADDLWRQCVNASKQRQQMIYDVNVSTQRQQMITNQSGQHHSISRWSTLTQAYPSSDTVSPNWHLTCCEFANNTNWLIYKHVINQYLNVSGHQIITSRSGQCRIVSKWSHHVVSRCSMTSMSQSVTSADDHKSK